MSETEILRELISDKEERNQMIKQKIPFLNNWMEYGFITGLGDKTGWWGRKERASSHWVKGGTEKLRQRDKPVWMLNGST